MFLKFKIFCTCHCEYTVSENLCTDKIVCPNCGMVYPHSAKLISILDTAKGIPDGNRFNKEIQTTVISEQEDMSNCQ